MLDRILDDYRFSGFIYTSDGDRFLTHGLADYENNISFERTSRFCIASLTKQFTAFAVMLCMEKGLLDIADSVSRYIPEYVYGDKITIRNLLDMTSGITDAYPSEDEVNAVSDCFNGDTIHKEYWEKYIACFISEFSEGSLFDYLNSQPPSFAAGEDYLYSNFNYLLLGIIVQRVAGTGLDEFLSEHVFGILGMNDTFFGTSKAIIKGYDRDLYTELPDYSGADFGMVSTIDDLIKWCSALLNRRILNSESYDMLLSPNKFGYCFGLHKAEGKNVYRHDGVMMTMQIEMSFDYDSGEISIGLMNRLPEPSDERRIMYYPISDIDDGKVKLEVWDMLSNAEFSLYSLELIDSGGKTCYSVKNDDIPLLSVKNNGKQRNATEFTTEEERSIWLDMNEMLGGDYKMNERYYLRAEAYSTELSQLGMVHLSNGEWVSRYYNVFHQRKSALDLFIEAVSIVGT